LGVQPYTKLDDFLNHTPMDFVAIGSPSGLHAAQWDRGCRTRSSRPYEKPIDISVATADTLIQAARTRNVKLGVMFRTALKPEIRKLKRWIEQGVLGRPLLADRPR
jgi:predicted dehydrogenase